MAIRKSLMVVAGALALGASSSLASAQTYDWTLSGLDSGSGTFITTAAAGGGLDVASFTGTINGFAVSEIGGNPGAVATSPTGAFYYDNIVFPAGAPVLDVDGLLLSYDGIEANIYSNSAADYAFLTYDGSSYGGNSTGDLFTISFVPEPASLAAFGAGLLALGVTLRRRNA